MAVCDHVIERETLVALLEGDPRDWSVNADRDTRAAQQSTQQDRRNVVLEDDSSAAC
jgi:hypothetical protein